MIAMRILTPSVGKKPSGTIGQAEPRRQRPEPAAALMAALPDRAAQLDRPAGINQAH
jgi:hypothetical protein